jgi:heterodisulfide reductase subunit A2
LKPVLVIGGGIAGIQASLDLADRGMKVHLIERTPSIGGVMAQLDKTFPTMDCSICILAPKMIECFRHPNITIHTLSEVVGLEGRVGDFNIKVLEHPRSVDITKCTGCGLCSEKCPVKRPDDFQAGLGQRKAIYRAFPQAVPLVANIDRDACLWFTKSLCRTCEKVCPAKAIDYEQKENIVELNVSSIIAATGFEQYNPKDIGEYGYGRYKNVLTALEFERLVCASGPTGGALSRPSDGKISHNIAFIQCVGSRTQTTGYPYCSASCCMYATKEAVLIKEHEPSSHVSIFYMDLRTFGKGFQGFVDRAQTHWGVKYIRGRPGEIREDPLTKNLTILYENTEIGRVEKEEFDLIVLCTAAIPHRDNRKLGKVLNLKLDEFGFFADKDSITAPVETDTPGIYVCGSCHGPRDIPESVTEASATAAKAAEDAARSEVKA